MKIQMLLTADSATVDTATGKMNILGAFNRIGAKRFPTIHPRMAVVVKLVPSELNETTAPRLVEIVMNDDDAHIELVQMSGAVQIPIDKRGNRREASIVMEINALEFPHPGMYTFHVNVDGEPIGETTIELVQA